MSTALEQLRTAHHLALRAHHASRFRAAELILAWPALATAAQSVQLTLAPGSPGNDRIAERIALDANSLEQSLKARRWPGPEKPDASFLQVTTALNTSRSLVPDTPVPTDDTHEAHRLIASTLWTTAQIVRRATREHYFDLTVANRSPSVDDMAEAKAAIDLSRRFNAIEQLAASSLTGHDSRERTVDGPGSSLRQAVAGWDIYAHRALVADPSTTVLHVLAHFETVTVKGFELLVERAAGARAIDPGTAERISPILHDSSASWQQLRDTAADLSHSTTRVPLAFIDSAKVMQEALTAAAFAAGHADHVDILRSIAGHLHSAVTISATARDAIDNGQMRAPARAVSRLLVDRPGLPSPQVAPVDPVAMHRGLSIPINRDVRELLTEPIDRVFHNAHEAVQRASGLDALQRKQLSAKAPPGTPQTGSPARSTPLAPPKGTASPATSPPR